MIPLVSAMVFAEKSDFIFVSAPLYPLRAFPLAASEVFSLSRASST